MQYLSPRVCVYVCMCTHACKYVSMCASSSKPLEPNCCVWFQVHLLKKKGYPPEVTKSVIISCAFYSLINNCKYVE